MFKTWFMFSCICHYLGMSQGTNNIKNVFSCGQRLLHVESKDRQP